MALIPAADIVARLMQASRGRSAPGTRTTPDQEPRRHGSGPDLAVVPLASSAELRCTAPGCDPRELWEEVPGLLDTAFEALGLFRQPRDTESSGLAVIALQPRAAGADRAVYAAETDRAPMSGAAWARSVSGAHPDAAVLFLVCADFDRTAASHEVAGYAGLLVAGGALAQGLALACSSRGLNCRISTTGCHAGTSAARSRHPGMRHLLTLAVGHTCEDCA
ncbi:hypothetical protein AB0B78_26955 [Streptomyces sp. NPDC040724]|uniref:hypothetical protein n=1 Tax=unclassified Streptomyces TaxID=2593676 RepID=UPI00340054EB